MTLAERIADTSSRIELASRKSGRKPGSVLLVAVSKTHAPETVAAAARAGLSTFGENRVQEAAGKRPAVARILGNEQISWHMVGHLQSNKARVAADLFDLIQSVDDAELARKLDQAAGASGKRQAILIQVNVAGERAKSGVSPENLRDLVDTVAALRGLELRGLMTIPPYDPEPERSRRHFAALRELGEKTRGWIGEVPHRGELSMGMSEDFEVAIEEGATIIRVGRAIFGERQGA